jgi:DNA integrity scanning protein DisA with diadenylate cyclase activity
MIKFNLKKSIWNDYLMMVFMIFPIIFSGFLIYFLLIKEKNIWVISTFAMFIPLFILLLFLRIKYIKSFLHGMTLLGTILGIWFFKDRGRIEYIYVYDQKNHKHGQAIMKNKFTTKLKQGQAIHVLKKQDNGKTLIRDLYFDVLNQ